MRRLLREPLFHFLLAGIAIFALAGRVGGGSDSAGQRIVVDDVTVANLVTGFERTWMRPPTPDELSGLVEDFVKEEILYREALALGLDRDDVVIRRRLRQKMEFLQADMADRGEIGDAELLAFLDENPERFEVPASVTFRQIFVDPQRSNGAPEARAAEILALLQSDPDAAGQPLGDATLLPPILRRATPRVVSGQFGPGFFEAIAELPAGSWAGPVPSTYGLHLVLVDELEPSRRPELGEVRPAVERELRAVRRSEAGERFYRQLRERYEVVIEDVGPSTASP